MDNTSTDESRLVETAWPDPWGWEAPPSSGRRLLDLVATYGLVLLLFAVLAVPLVWLVWSSEREQEQTAEELALLAANSRMPEPAIESTTPGVAQDTPVPAEVAPTAWLRISSFPLGATVWVNGDSVGVTPLSLSEVAIGFHAVVVQKEAYTEQDSLVYLTGGTYESLLFMLAQEDHSDALPQPGIAGATPQPEQNPSQREQNPSSLPRGAAAQPSASEGRSATGAVTITSEPAGAAVLLDGRPIGPTPAMLEAVPVGRRHISLHLDGYELFTSEVDVQPDTVVTLQGTLVEAHGTVSLLVRPWGSIYINGALHQQDTDVMYRTELPIGTHQIRAVHPTLGGIDRMVHLESGDEVELVLDLNEAAHAQAAERAEPLAAQATRSVAVDENGIYLVTHGPVELIGGLEELQRKAVYPSIARRVGREGRVYVRFIVDAQGQVQNPSVVRGIGAGCDEEALQIISQARFRPATVEGRPVATWHTLFINFKLER